MRKDLRDPPALQVLRVRPDLRVRRVLPAPQDLVAQQARPDLPDLRVLQVLVVPQGLPDQLDLPVRLALLVQPAQRDRLVQPVPRLLMRL